MGIQRSDARAKRASGVGRARSGFLLVAGLAATVASGALAADDSGGGRAASASEPILRETAFRPSSDARREPPLAAPIAQPPTAAAGDDTVMLRMLASEDVAVPIEKLGDALVTTGSIARRSPDAPAMPAGRPSLPATVASLLPVQPDAVRPMPNGVLAAVERNFDASAAAAADTAHAGQAGRIVSSVNMRTKPDSSAKTVSVLASNASVTVLGCKYWCEVEAAGQRGFVFKRFVAMR